MHFEWDRVKAASNRRKHNVAFVEAMSVFYDPLSATFQDRDSPATEERLITIGHSSLDRLWWLSTRSKMRQSGSLVHD